ncbi:50S ribosomal protein L25 [candidate division WWE3 bacterium]|uniref:Large ribosomal subunit protein bL25 n=1 Tax=candidate division WWE3 bacterium TaxID=2053526 RepID=A0A955LVY5_UNCKA|nr:50S ribosomal protein L25 [candidate division WWE3 bacterium]
MNKEKITIQVQPRDLLGNKVNKLRREGLLPANIYGSQVDSLSIQVPAVELRRLAKNVGESEVIYVEVEGEKDARPVLIGHTQLDPVSHELIHVDFRQIDMNQEVTVEVEIVFEGESPAAAQAADVVLLELMNVLEVTALPGNLPSEIVVDVSGLTEVDQSITVADLPLAEGVVASAEPDQLVCKVDVIQVKEEEPETDEELTQGDESADDGGEEDVTEEASDETSGEE